MRVLNQECELSSLYPVIAREQRDRGILMKCGNINEIATSTLKNKSFSMPPRNDSFNPAKKY